MAGRGMLSIVTKYVVLPGVFAYALMNIFKPNEEEIQKIKNYKPNNQFSQVLQAAASADSKPMYRQKPGEQHPLPELANEGKNINSK